MSKNYAKEYKGHKVPEGATHCDDARSMFYKETNEAVFSCEFGELIWVDTDFLDVTANIHLKELPEEPAQEWNGEGLPPVGCECEMTSDDGKWVLVEIIAVHIGFAHGWHDSARAVYYSDDASDFRPVKTQEQKDREAFIDRVMTGISIDVKHATIAHNIAEQLFDAGYKAPEGE